MSNFWPKLWTPPSPSGPSQFQVQQQLIAQTSNPFNLHPHRSRTSANPSSGVASIPTLFDAVDEALPTYEEVGGPPPPAFNIVGLRLDDSGCFVGPVGQVTAATGGMAGKGKESASESAIATRSGSEYENASGKVSEHLSGGGGLPLYELSASLLDSETKEIELRRLYHKARFVEAPPSLSSDFKAAELSSQREHKIKSTALAALKFSRDGGHFGMGNKFYIRPVLGSLGYLRTLSVNKKVGLGGTVWEFCVDVKWKEVPIRSTGGLMGDIKEVVRVKAKKVEDVYKEECKKKRLLAAKSRKGKGNGWDWVADEERLVAVEEKLDCGGAGTVLTIMVELDKGMMDLLVAAWCVRGWNEFSAS